MENSSEQQYPWQGLQHAINGVIGSKQHTQTAITVTAIPHHQEWSLTSSADASLGNHEQSKKKSLQEQPAFLNKGASLYSASASEGNDGSRYKNNTTTSKRKAPSSPNKKLKICLEPSVISSGSSITNSISNAYFDQGPPKEKTQSELDILSDIERRRYDRNLREQQRSYRISQQIKLLRDVLAESGIPFKPNKFSILVSVGEYMEQLQARSVMLDCEHKKLLDTIRKTQEIVASGISCSSDCSIGGSNNSPLHPQLIHGVDSRHASDKHLLLVQGIDYKSVFSYCSYSIGVASLDGRVLSCNRALQALFETNDMEQKSLFLYIRNHDDVFEAMANLLKRSSLAGEMESSMSMSSASMKDDEELLYWSGVVTSHRGQEVRLF
jgi:hypothetical protein